MPTTLRVNDLSVAFGARSLFTGLDLTLSDGDVTAVVGPNGSGKSTLMRTIVGDLSGEAGTIRLAPRDATIAWLPQVLPDASETLLAYARRRTGVEAADVELELASAALASGMPGGDARYAAALEHWLALGAADLDERLPEVAARVGLDVDPARPDRQPLGWAGGAGQPRRRAAQPLRRPAAGRADQRPRCPGARPHGRLRAVAHRARAHREPRPRLPRLRRDERRRAGPRPGPHRALHRLVERLRRPARPRPGARLGGLRGVCRRA